MTRTSGSHRILAAATATLTFIATLPAAAQQQPNTRIVLDSAVLAGYTWRNIGPDLRPLAIPAYRRLFIGQGFTVIGATLTAVAVQQQVFDLTGSSAWVGT